MEPISDIPLTRSPDEGRGMFGRVGEMQEANKRFEAARVKGEMADNEAVHKGTEKVVKAITGFIEKVGSKAEEAAKLDAKFNRGVEKTVKVVLNSSWEVIKGFGEDTVDVLEGAAKGALVGARWASMAAAVGLTTAAAAGPIILESAGVGLIELGQHGAKALAEARAAVNKNILHGIHALAASVDAKALAGKESEQNRIERVREQHAQRVEKIRENNLGVRIYRNLKG